MLLAHIGSEITRKWTFPVRKRSLIANLVINIFGEKTTVCGHLPEPQRCFICS